MHSCMHACMHACTLLLLLLLLPQSCGAVTQKLACNFFTWPKSYAMISPRHGFLTGRIQRTVRVNLDRVTTHHGPFRLHPTRLSVDCPSLLSPLRAGLLENCFSQCKSMFFSNVWGPGKSTFKLDDRELYRTNNRPLVPLREGFRKCSNLHGSTANCIARTFDLSLPSGGLFSQRKFLSYRASCSTSDFLLDSRFVVVIAIIMIILVVVVVVCRC